MSLGWGEMILLGLVGLLIFGKDLPQVSRNAGRAINELRRTLNSFFD